jgi:hypothetical protein
MTGRSSLAHSVNVIRVTELLLHKRQSQVAANEEGFVLFISAVGCIAASITLEIF